MTNDKLGPLKRLSVERFQIVGYSLRGTAFQVVLGDPIIEESVFYIKGVGFQQV